jgi:hypothetical protein
VTDLTPEEIAGRIKAPHGAIAVSRHERRVRCRIVSTSTYVLPDGVLIEPGENYVDVAESHMDVLRRQVRDEKLWDVAETAYLSAQEEWEKENGKAGSLKSPLSVERSYCETFRKQPGFILELKVLQEDIAPRLTEEDERVAAVHAYAQQNGGTRGRSSKG